MTQSIYGSTDNPDMRVYDGKWIWTGYGGRYIMVDYGTPMRGTDFAVEFDLEFISSVSPNDCVGYQFRSTSRDINGLRDYYDFCYYPISQQWHITKNNNVATKGYKIKSGEFDKDDMTLRLIAYGDYFAIYFDTELIATFQDSEIKGENNFILFYSTNDFRMHIDNLKFWNLDGRDF